MNEHLNEDKENLNDCCPFLEKELKPQVIYYA